uniref:Uncharacterized protein n=1 Tax=Desulfacinum infernum TaxID=35837 RepID=A0A832A298_9BACT
MVKRKERISFPDSKISETFLDFAEPLLLSAGAKITKHQFEKALRIAFTVWNSVVYDTVNGNSNFVTELKKYVADDPSAEALIERMISRKKTMFGDDLRLIGDYKIMNKKGQWRLRAEARDPVNKL